MLTRRSSLILLALALDVVGKASLSPEAPHLLVDTLGQSHTIDSFHIYTDGTDQDECQKMCLEKSGLDSVSDVHYLL